MMKQRLRLVGWPFELLTRRSLGRHQCPETLDAKCESQINRHAFSFPISVDSCQRQSNQWRFGAGVHPGRRGSGSARTTTCLAISLQCLLLNAEADSWWKHNYSSTYNQVERSCLLCRISVEMATYKVRSEVAQQTEGQMGGED